MKVMERTKYVEGTHFVSSDATNPQAMFNNTISDKSTKAGKMTVVLTPGAIYSVGFAGLEGTDLTVYGTVGGDEVFRHEQSLQDNLVTDWFEYYFDPFTPIQEVFVQVAESWLGNIPPYSDMVLTIEIDGASTACGVCAFGRMYEFGSTTAGAKLEFLDYSSKDTNPTTGVTTFTEGPSAKLITAEVFADNKDMNRLQYVLSQMRATPTFWNFAGGADYEGVFVVFGFFRDFSIVVNYPKNFLSFVEVEGLI